MSKTAQALQQRTPRHTNHTRVVVRPGDWWRPHITEGGGVSLLLHRESPEGGTLELVFPGGWQEAKATAHRLGLAVQLAPPLELSLLEQLDEWLRRLAKFSGARNAEGADMAAEEVISALQAIPETHPVREWVTGMVLELVTMARGPRG